MKNTRTATHTFLTASGIEAWLEHDVYCPRLIIKRPRTLKHSYSFMFDDTKQVVEQIIEWQESIFIQDLLFNLIANPKINNEVKLALVIKLKEVAEEMERIIQEHIQDKIESDAFEDDNLNS